jgi:2-dehydro-3-deoxygluconokinase
LHGLTALEKEREGGFIMTLEIRERTSCKYDLVSLGECMIRLSPPGHERLEFAPRLEVWVGGGEYNVAYALARLGLRTGWVGKLPQNPLGRLILNHGRAVGVDMGHVVLVPFDGVGKKNRVGLNFTEVGTGLRSSVTMYDRGHSATSLMQPGDVDWENLFQKEGVRWFHLGGIFTALGDHTPAVSVEAMEAAKKAGTIVSYDLNFRSKLWSSEKAQEVTRPLVQYMDFVIGNEEDFQG